MSKLRDHILTLPISGEEARELFLRIEKLSEGKRAFLENNPRMFNSLKDIDEYLKDRENSKDIENSKKDLFEMTSNIPEQSYSAIDSTIIITKIFFWLAFLIAFIGWGISTGFSGMFWATSLPISFLAMLVYAQIQLLEAFVNTAKNTNKTNLLIDINNQLLKELINKVFIFF